MLARTRAWLKRQHDLHKACVFETVREYMAHHKKVDKRKALQQAFSRKYWGWWLLLAVVIAISIALSVYHDRMVLAIRPVAEKILHTPGAWAVPVAALVIVSVPPLVGHEVIILVVGVIWGLWWGFLIAVAGTFIGEILCYYLFKYLLRERAKKIEDKSELYASLANIMRRDGLWMISMVRFSAIPGHVTTAIQATIGISVWIFGIACAISLPKQLALVYLGVLFGESHKLPAEDGLVHEDKGSARTHTIVSWSVLCITGWLTVVALYVIWFRIWLVRRTENKETLSTVGSKEELLMDEAKASDMRYTLPYMQCPSSDSMKRDRSSSHASSSTAPTIHSYGRPHVVRTRSSTLSTLAFSNNSLPYLPYTPMLEMHPSFPVPPRNLPSPIPNAVVSFPVALPEEQRTCTAPRLEHGESKVSHPSALSGGPVSPRGSPANSEVSIRARRVRLARSSSNMLLPASSVKSSSAPAEEFGSHDNVDHFPPSIRTENIAAMERAASPAGRLRARSRASTLTVGGANNLPGRKDPLEHSREGLP